ncbi:MAG: tetratricopeptide repeat-containing protein, partial [Pyrinomonadaceae bacterium]|nr:tetratricopeptide repeat-containing protein [Pyrinomonadaceae bacterium]
YKWIVNEKPELAVGFYFLAICYDKLQEYEDALANYEQFLQLADVENGALEIEKVNLRLPVLKKQIKRGLGKKSQGG